MPQPCSRRRLGLTFETATASVLDISSAGTGRGERNRSACTCATVRLMPQRVPISPQWRMNFWATGVSGVFVLSLISVITEYTVWTLACQALFLLFPPALSPHLCCRTSGGVNASQSPVHRSRHLARDFLLHRRH